MILALALLASFALTLVPGGKYATYPFRIFTTWAHECSHALAVLCVGGKVSRVTLAADTSGLTHFELKPGRFRHAFVASSGYLGASAAGCAIYFAALTHPTSPRNLLLILASALALSGLLWIRNGFGVIVVTLLALSFFGLGYFRHPLPATEVLAFLGVQTGLQSFFDIPVLFGLHPRVRSDATTMRRLFWLPSVFWALSWLGLSLGMMIWTVRRAGHLPF
jgi:hypothetical protein